MKILQIYSLVSLSAANAAFLLWGDNAKSRLAGLLFLTPPLVYLVLEVLK